MQVRDKYDERSITIWEFRGMADETMKNIIEKIILDTDFKAE